MGSRGSDRNGVFSGRSRTGKPEAGRVGKCARLIGEQKDRIEAALFRQKMTITDMAESMKLSRDTIRNRLNEMIVEGRPIRVAGWKVLDTTMVRVWGVGTEGDEPKPVRVRVATARKRQKEAVPHREVNAPSTVRFRREGMDEWLFRIREMR